MLFSKYYQSIHRWLFYVYNYIHTSILYYNLIKAYRLNHTVCALMVSYFEQTAQVRALRGV